ncbi:MAG: hypothetical protein KC457_01700 [Myxococcales bacterium]|nr:hypothetical protein [Myxococcales bacterium]
MPNPIIDTTVALLGRLDQETRAVADAGVRARSLDALGEEIDLETQLNLMKAAKYIAAADGLSAAELRSMKTMMEQYDLPDSILWHILEFDESEVEPGHVGELAQPGHGARLLLSAMAHFAAVDGLSELEENRAIEVGRALSIAPKVVEALLVEARINYVALRRRDEEQLQLLRQLRFALFDLDCRE